MKYKYSLLGMAAGAALLVAGCSKSEAPATTAADNTVKRSAPAVEAPKVAEVQTAAAVKPAPAVTPTAAPAPAVVPAPAPAATPVASPAPAAAAAPAATPATTLQSAFQAQQVALAQTVTNQLRALAAAATNGVLSALGVTNSAGLSAGSQLQALASAATNQVRTALSMTNQVVGMATNQVQALLERAKTLTSNQKYQEALATVSQLYETKLTPEQKQKADELKVQIQTALTQKAAAEASSALGNFFGGKKQ